jgi:hypothetical protein
VALAHEWDTMSKRSPGCLADMWELSVGIARRSSHHVAVTLEGNIVADLELAYTPSGKPVVRFSVLVNRRRKGPTPNSGATGR